MSAAEEMRVRRPTAGGPSKARAVSGALAVTLIALPSAVVAQSRDLQSVWIIEPTVVPPGERALASGEFVLKQRLLPIGLAELEGPVTAGKETLPSGSQLVKVQTSAAKVFCVPDLPKKVFWTTCLIDADNDGSFEAWDEGFTRTRSILMVSGKYPKKPKPIEPARYREVSPTSMRSVYFVGIERRNWFNIYSRESFTIAYGSEGRLERLTTPISFKTNEMPRELTVLGARFTAISEPDGKMLVRVSQAMPLQPFAVTVTTTYR